MIDDPPNTDNELTDSFEALFDLITPTPPQRVGPPDALEERDRGFLSETDREFLCGDWTTDSDYPKQVRSNNKAKIRQRSVDAFRDLPYLLALDSAQRSKIYEELGRGDVRSSLGALIAFVYLASDKDADLIEEGVSDGIYTGESEVPPADSEKGEIEDVSVYFDVEYAPNVDDIYHRFKEKPPSALSSGEIGILVQENKLSTEELIELNKPEDVRHAEEIAASIEEALDESEADTFERWEGGLTVGDGDELENLDEAFAELIHFDSSHPEKDVRDNLSDEYLGDDDGS